MNSEVNLLKNNVISFKKRRIIFAAIIYYLVICGIILVFLFYKITASYVRTSRINERIAREEYEFCQRYAEGKNLPEYTENIKSKMAFYTKKLITLDDILSKRINMTRLLLSFSTPLPPGAYIDNLHLNSTTKALNFDIVASLDTKQSVFDAGNLISAWKSDISLMNDIENIKSSESQKQKQKGGSKLTAIIFKFYCSLSKGGNITQMGKTKTFKESK